MDKMGVSTRCISEDAKQILPMVCLQAAKRIIARHQTQGFKAWIIQMTHVQHLRETREAPLLQEFLLEWKDPTEAGAVPMVAHISMEVPFVPHKEIRVGTSNIEEVNEHICPLFLRYYAYMCVVG